MAAPDTEQVGIDFLLKVDTTLIGGATDATYSRSTSNPEVTNKDSGRYAEHIATTKEASIDFNGGFVESGQQSGQGVTVEVSTDGGSNFEELAGVTNVSLGFALALIDRTDADSNRWRELLPGTRSSTLSVDLNYIDPESETALDTILSQHDSGSTILVKVTLGSFEYEADFFVDSDSLSTPVNDAAGTSLSMTRSDTEPSITDDSNDDGLQALFTAIENDPPDSLTALIEVQDTGGTAVSGATSREGDFYPESLTIDIPFDGEATISGTLQNDGAVARGPQT
jgi:predicted secreted protein